VATAPYNRILLKLSGEALMGDQSYGIDADTLTLIAGEIKNVLDMGVEAAVVGCRGHGTPAFSALSGSGQSGAL